MDQLIRELESLSGADAAPLQLAYRVIRVAFGEETDAAAWIVDHGNPLTSLDAALTLVPEGWSWRVGNLPSGKGFADLGTQASLQCVEGATPPLALCIAALKARAHV